MIIRIVNDHHGPPQPVSPPSSVPIEIPIGRENPPGARAGSLAWAPWAGGRSLGRSWSLLQPGPGRCRVAEAETIKFEKIFVMSETCSGKRFSIDFQNTFDHISTCFIQIMKQKKHGITWYTQAVSIVIPFDFSDFPSVFPQISRWKQGPPARSRQPSPGRGQRALLRFGVMEAVERFSRTVVGRKDWSNEGEPKVPGPSPWWPQFAQVESVYRSWYLEV